MHNNSYRCICINYIKIVTCMTQAGSIFCKKKFKLISNALSSALASDLILPFFDQSLPNTHLTNFEAMAIDPIPLDHMLFEHQLFAPKITKDTFSLRPNLYHLPVKRMTMSEVVLLSGFSGVWGSTNLGRAPLNVGNIFHMGQHFSHAPRFFFVLPLHTNHFWTPQITGLETKLQTILYFF